MQPEFIVVIFVLFSLLAITAAVLSHKQQQQRRDALAQHASAHGWVFEPGKDHAHDQRYSDLSLFNQGQDRYAYNTTSGAAPIGDLHWPMQYGDYHYSTTSGTGKDRKTQHHRLSYVIVETPYLGTPNLLIRQENFLDKVAGALGFDDIDFESAEFSGRFVVKSRDKRFAYDVVHPRLMEFLLAGEPPAIEFSRGRCCLWRGQRCWPPEQFAATLDWAAEFFAHWPRHLTPESFLDNPRTAT